MARPPSSAILAQSSSTRALDAGGRRNISEMPRSTYVMHHAFKAPSFNALSAVDERLMFLNCNQRGMPARLSRPSCPEGKAITPGQRQAKRAREPETAAAATTSQRTMSLGGRRHDDSGLATVNAGSDSRETQEGDDEEMEEDKDDRGKASSAFVVDQVLPSCRRQLRLFSALFCSRDSSRERLNVRANPAA